MAVATEYSETSLFVSAHERGVAQSRNAYLGKGYQAFMHEGLTFSHPTILLKRPMLRHRRGGLSRSTLIPIGFRRARWGHLLPFSAFRAGGRGEARKMLLPSFVFSPLPAFLVTVYAVYVTGIELHISVVIIAILVFSPGKVSRAVIPSSEPVALLLFIVCFCSAFRVH